MTGEEIARSTPAEINARIDGYARRMRDKRLFTAALVSLPIVNYSSRGPRHSITLQKFLPDDFKLESPDSDSVKTFKALRDESEKQRKEVKHGRS